MEAAAGALGSLKLLLDAHHSPRIAERLVAVGLDVAAASSDPLLASLDDELLLEAAAASGRALVTENARDFDRIAKAWASEGRHHAGILFTSPRRFRRSRTAYPNDIIRALKEFINKAPVTGRDWLWWL